MPSHSSTPSMPTPLAALPPSPPFGLDPFPRTRWYPDPSTPMLKQGRCAPAVVAGAVMKYLSFLTSLLQDGRAGMPATSVVTAEELDAGDRILAEFEQL